MSQQLLTPAFSRLDPDASARLRRAQAGAPTRAQKSLELGLFIFFGLTIALAAVAIYAVNSPDHRLVPSSFESGMRAGRANVLILETTTRNSNGSRITSIDGLTLIGLKADAQEAALLSIPRDLWVRVGRFGTHRIASAAAIGNSSGYPGEGVGLTVDTVSEVTGQPVHAYLRLDSPRLRKLIDDLGGIDLQVRTSFYEYRTRDRFRPGPQHMDGQRALRYARSPYVLGPAGDRFARELRQQEVLTAVFSRLASAGPQMRERLVLTSTDGEPMTNLEADELARLLAAFGNSESLRHVSLAPLLDRFEVATFGDPAGEAVRPRSGDYSEVQQITREVFGGASTATTAAAALSR
jgi:LCP family protein required for cell wall assembly